MYKTHFYIVAFDQIYSNICELFDIYLLSKC